MVGSQAAEENKFILRWITHHLSKPQSKLEGLAICPYALKTIQANRYKIIPGKRPINKFIYQQCYDFDQAHSDIYIIWYDKISEAYQDRLCSQIKHTFPELVVLYDNKENNGKIKGLQFSYQRKDLFMIQHLDTLKRHQKLLREKTNWYQLVGNEDMFI